MRESSSSVGWRPWSEDLGVRPINEWIDLLYINVADST